MDKTEEAVSKFRNPYSCAQTIYAAFSDAPNADGMSAMKAASAGRAPDGLCGALYAAKLIKPDSAAEIEQKFKASTGATKCAELKTVYKTPCSECVRAAACALAE